MKKTGSIFCALLILSQSLLGCVPRPDAVRPAHVQPETYSHLSCEQITFKKQSSASELANLSDQQNDEASADAAYFWVGLLLFWPAWFGFVATDDHSSEIAQLKGESKALDSVYMQRCLDDTAPAS